MSKSHTLAKGFRDRYFSELASNAEIDPMKTVKFKMDDENRCNQQNDFANYRNVKFTVLNDESIETKTILPSGLSKKDFSWINFACNLIIFLHNRIDFLETFRTLCTDVWQTMHADSIKNWISWRKSIQWTNFSRLNYTLADMNICGAYSLAGGFIKPNNLKIHVNFYAQLASLFKP